MKMEKTLEKDATSVALGESEFVSKEIKINAKFITEALRSTGYDSFSSIYELIDNSIDAECSSIVINYNNKTNTLILQDNGKGMSLDELGQSMDIGFDRDYTNRDIGFFGTGMKSACLNLVDIDLYNSVEILTNNNSQKSIVKWEPIKNPLGFDIKTTSSYVKKGTTIVINGVKKFQLAKLKKYIGVVFYNTLKTDTIDIIVNDIRISPIDPLYRHSKNTQIFYTESRVKEHTIRIEAVILDSNESRSSWDSKTNDGRWSNSKSGLYIVYGGRYIEFGGWLDLITNDPWMNHTRFEFTIPKELTMDFGIKFNKTKGLIFKDKEVLDDLRVKIKGLINQLRSIMKKNRTSSLTDEDNMKFKDITKNLNKSANRARLKIDDNITKNIKLTEKQKEIDSDLKDKIKRKKKKIEDEENSNKEKNNNKPKIRENKVFDFISEPLLTNEVFWYMKFVNNILVMVINENHIFYREIFGNLSYHDQDMVAHLIASMAYAQYETMNIDEIDSTSIEYFWEDYWSKTSNKLRNLLS